MKSGQGVRVSSESRPSQVRDEYWLFAKRKRGNYPASTANSGKWLIFAPISQIDEMWTKIKHATEDGRLGDWAKVATAKPNPNASDPATKVICVYTYDWTDEADVGRIPPGAARPGNCLQDSIQGGPRYRLSADTLSGAIDASPSTTNSPRATRSFSLRGL